MKKQKELKHHFSVNIPANNTYTDTNKNLLVKYQPNLRDISQTSWSDSWKPSI